MSSLKMILNTLSRPGVVFYTLAWLMVLLIMGTVAQRYVGLYAAQQTFFYSTIWWIGPLPTPGGLTTLGVLTAGLAARTFIKGRWTRAQTGTQITHLGALLLLLGGLLTFITVRDGEITLFPGDRSNVFVAYADQNLPGQSAHRLPFEVELVTFNKTLYPNSDIPKSYESTVIIHDQNGTAWRAHIRMNEPLRYRGYTLYQSSFVETGNRVASVLAVVHNTGRLFPYFASIMMALGLLIHLGVRMRHHAAVLVMTLILISPSVQAKDSPSGLARGPQAIQEQTHGIPGMRRGSDSLDLNNFAHIPVQDQGRIKPMDTFARSWLETFSGRDTADGYAAINWMADVLFAPERVADIRIFRVQSAAVRDALALPQRSGSRYTFKEITAALTRTRDMWAPLLNMPVESQSLPQKQLLELVENIDIYVGLTHTFDAVRTSKTSKAASPFGIELAIWRDVMTAYSTEDTTAFKAATYHLRYDVTLPAATNRAMGLEVMFNRLHIFTLSVGLYLFAVLLALLALYKSRPLWVRATIAILGAAITVHITGLVMRMMIMGRPPVTNLYDSILFVGLIAVIITAGLAWRGRSRALFLSAAIIGAVLQTIGLKFDAEGDTIRVLTAVLDTNFWLSTHVVMITIGYGTSIVTAMIAHGILIKKAFISPPIHGPHTTLHLISIGALFATATGTILGGIWADQSWGRFWGWDPKENGALLIVLWIIWALHGRLSGHLRDTAFVAVLAALNIIVACAWFGVNLLGVGLHSYGFTATALQGFITFCTVDALLIGVLCLTIYHRGRTQHAV